VLDDVKSSEEGEVKEAVGEDTEGKWNAKENEVNEEKGDGASSMKVLLSFRVFSAELVPKALLMGTFSLRCLPLRLLSRNCPAAGQWAHLATPATKQIQKEIRLIGMEFVSKSGRVTTFICNSQNK